MDAFYKEAEKRIARSLQEGAIVLDLSSMNLTKIPETIAHLSALTELNLGVNK